MRPFFLPFDDLIPELAGVLQAIGGIMLVCGLINALFGYKLFKLVLAIAGFLTGTAIGAIAALFIGKGDLNGGVVLLCALVGGIIGAVLAVVLHRLGVFLAVGATAFILLLVPTENVPVSLVLGIVCGIIGAILEKYAIIVSTGLSGGSLAARGIGFMVQLSSGATTIIGLLISACGIAFQLWMELSKPAAAAGAATAVAAAQPRPQPQSQPQPGAAVPAAAVLPASAPVEQNVPHCSNCGCVLSAGASFCPSCGHKVAEEPSEKRVFCGKCGAEMSGTANFCKKCGTARSV